MLIYDDVLPLVLVELMLRLDDIMILASKNEEEWYYYRKENKIMVSPTIPPYGLVYKLKLDWYSLMFVMMEGILLIETMMIWSDHLMA